jgi:hypothetical protein
VITPQEQCRRARERYSWMREDKSPEYRQLLYRNGRRARAAYWKRQSAEKIQRLELKRHLLARAAERALARRK